MEQVIGTTELRQQLTDVLQAVREKRATYIVETFGRSQPAIVNLGEYRQFQSYRRDREAYFNWLDRAASANAEHNRDLGEEAILAIIEQARDEVRYGMCKLENYREHINPGAGIDWSDTDRAVDQLNEQGFAVIGTPEMARAQIDRLIEKSGGFGCYMLMGVDWARHDATLRSHQLFAEEVIPYYRGTNRATLASFEDVMGTGFEGAEITARAQEAMARVYAQNK